MTAPTRLLYGFPIDAMTMEEAVQRCRAAIASRQPVLVGVLNAAKLVASRRDERLRRSLLDCDMLLADGQSIVWASRLLRRPLPERVAGIDLFEHLLHHADKHGLSVFLLGARPQVLAKLEDRIRDQFPGIRLAGSQHGYFDDTDSERIAERISCARADMLFIGMSSPRKENFLARYASSLNVPLLHGVGGSFDVLAGQTRRAPAAWQRLGMEWAYRVLQEPGRLWWRYLSTNSAFIALTLQELVHPARALRPVPPNSHERLDALKG